MNEMYEYVCRYGHDVDIRLVLLANDL
jgi:hypothetical protein